jgi:hypothetical protein
MAAPQSIAPDVQVGRFGKPGGVSTYHLANIYIHAGDRDHAPEWLERACEVRDPNMPYLRSPVFDSLRSDPRYQALLDKMKFPK